MTPKDFIRPDEDPEEWNARDADDPRTALIDMLAAIALVLILIVLAGMLIAYVSVEITDLIVGEAVAGRAFIGMGVLK